MFNYLFFKNLNTLFLTCALAFISIANAQEVRVIDNKGTIKMVNNNQVTTDDAQPTDPLEGDVWVDTSAAPNIIKVWDGVGSWISINTQFRAIPGNKVTGLKNANFETEVDSVKNFEYSYTLTNAFWTFIGPSGIQKNGSLWNANAAPEGVQTAFMTDDEASMSQWISFTSSDNFAISFKASRRRAAWNQTFEVYLDLVLLGTFAPITNTFESYTTNSIFVTAGLHNLRFQNTTDGGKRTVFIDDISTQQVANSTFQVNGSISTGILNLNIAGDLTLTEDHYTVIIESVSNINLPIAASCKGRTYILKNISGNDRTTSIDYKNNSNTDSKLITNNSTITLQSDGINWQELLP